MTGKKEGYGMMWGNQEDNGKRSAKRKRYVKRR